MPGRETVNPVKEQLVNDTAKLISDYPIIGLIDLKGFPAAALQEIKAKLHGRGMIKVVRKKLLRFALEKTKTSLIEHIPDQPALILTEENPFKIYKFIVQNKSACSAKVGDVTEDEIIVSAGPTDLMPGPAMTTLSSVKIKSKVDGGKIAILSDVTVAKAGDTIDDKLSSVLSMLKMKPMKVGLNVKVVLEGETIYPQDVLYIDEVETLANLAQASNYAFNLSVEACYPTKENIEFIISKAFGEAKNLCVEASILEKDFIDDVLAKAVREANVLKELVPDAPEAKEAKPEEKTDEKVNDTDTTEESTDTKPEETKDNDQEKKEEK
jgi:large subunit ribosomal protein L10